MLDEMKKSISKIIQENKQLKKDREVLITRVASLKEEVISVRQRGRNRNNVVLIKFKKEGIRKELFRKKKEIGTLDLVDCGIGNRKGSIYFDEDLLTDIRKLFQKARELRKHGFRYIWFKDEQILVRKSNFSNVIKIKCENQIIEMMAPAKQQE
ncbi:hypothetical protein WA026_019302 [Henosepilachna vigintioctopunctata]|uniref:FP protein C-terminal domain-containing protein n=1 Tax=Henosepilachna vigintioctopunctata TaxID=420089 RepID=A0AAW1U1M5_9CUCU